MTTLETVSSLLAQGDYTHARAHLRAFLSTNHLITEVEKRTIARIQRECDKRFESEIEDEVAACRRPFPGHSRKI